MSDIYSMQQIRQYILERYHTNPKIRINASLSEPKLHWSNVEVTITGVYAHIFRIEKMESGQKKRYTLQYADVLLHHIELLDLHTQENEKILF